MTDWPLGTPTNNDAPPNTKENLHRHKLLEEVAKFQKNMEELRLLRTISNDLKNYRRMIRIKRND
jgi:hypothetical protein